MRPTDISFVRFRELRQSDASKLYSGAFGIAEVTKHIQWDTHTSVATTENLVEEMIDLHQRGLKYFWVALNVHDERIVGLGSIKPDDTTAWIGFLVVAEEQRKGFGSAILSALEAAALKDFESVSAAVEQQNLASVLLLERACWVAWECPQVHPLKALRKTKGEKVARGNGD